MLDKDPQNYSALQYAWVIGLAAWGGAVAYIQKIQQEGSGFKLQVFVSELLTSGLSGMLAFFLCEMADISGLMAAVLIAIAGHTGGEFVAMVKGGVMARYGNRVETMTTVEKENK